MACSMEATGRLKSWLFLCLTATIVFLLLPHPASALDVGQFIKDVWNGMVKTVMDSIKNIIRGFINLIPNALVSPTINKPQIDRGSYLAMSGMVMTIVMPLLSFAIIHTAIKLLLASASPGERYAAKSQLQNLLVGLLIIPFSPHLYQILIDLSHEYTIQLLGGPKWHCGGQPYVCPQPPPMSVEDCRNYVKGCSTPSVPGLYQDVVPPDRRSLGDAVLAVYDGISMWSFIYIFCCTMLVVLSAVTVIFLRHMMVILFAVLMPLTCFLYLFDFTKSLGRKFLKYSITWALTPIAMALWIIIAGVMLVNTGKGVDPYAGTFMCTVFLSMITLSPLIITGALETLGAIVTSIGQVTGGFTGAAMVAAGQMMQAKSAEALMMAGMKIGGQAGMSAMKAMPKAVGGLAKAGKAAGAAVKGASQAGGVKGFLAAPAMMVAAGVVGLGRGIGKAGKAIGSIGGKKVNVGRVLGMAVKPAVWAGKGVYHATRGVAAGVRLVTDPLGSFAKGGKMIRAGKTLGGAKGAMLQTMGAGLRVAAVAAMPVGLLLNPFGMAGKAGKGLLRKSGRGFSAGRSLWKSGNWTSGAGMASKLKGAGLMAVGSTGALVGSVLNPFNAMGRLGNAMSRPAGKRVPGQKRPKQGWLAKQRRAAGIQMQRGALRAGRFLTGNRLSMWARSGFRRVGGFLGRKGKEMMSDQDINERSKGIIGQAGTALKREGWLKGKVDPATGKKRGYRDTKMGKWDQGAGSRLRRFTGIPQLGSYVGGKFKGLGRVLKAGGQRLWGQMKTTRAVGRAIGRGYGAVNNQRRRLYEASANYLERGAGGREIRRSIDNFAQRSLGKSLMGAAIPAAVIGALAITGMGLGVPYAGGIALGALVLKGAQMMGADKAAGAAIRDNAKMRSFFAGMNLGGPMFSKDAAHAMKGSESQGAFMTGRSVGLGLKLIAGLAAFAMFKAPMMGVEFAMTGGLSPAIRAGMSLFSAPGAMNRWAQGVKDFDETRRGKSRTGGRGLAVGTSEEQKGMRGAGLGRTEDVANGEHATVQSAISGGQAMNENYTNDATARSTAETTAYGKFKGETKDFASLDPKERAERIEAAKKQLPPGATTAQAYSAAESSYRQSIHDQFYKPGTSELSDLGRQLTLRECARGDARAKYTDFGRAGSTTQDTYRRMAETGQSPDGTAAKDNSGNPIGPMSRNPGESDADFGKRVDQQAAKLFEADRGAKFDANKGGFADQLSDRQADIVTGKRASDLIKGAINHCKKDSPSFSSSNAANRLAYETGMDVPDAEKASAAGVTSQSIAGQSHDQAKTAFQGAGLDFDDAKMAGIKSNAENAVRAAVGGGAAVAGSASAKDGDGKKQSEADREEQILTEAQTPEAREPGAAAPDAGSPSAAPSAQPGGAEAAAGGKPQGAPSSGTPGAMGAAGAGPATPVTPETPKDQEAAKLDHKEQQDQWYDIKQEMMHSGMTRHRREKGSGEQLEEMLEDRDERPSR